MSQQQDTQEKSVNGEDSTQTDSQNTQSNTTTSLNYESLAKLNQNFKNSKKKNKGGNVSDTSSTVSSVSGKKGKKQKKTVINPFDFSEINEAFQELKPEGGANGNAKSSNSQSKSHSQLESKSSQPSIIKDSSEKYQAILATVGGQIDEGDVMRICQNISKIRSEPGYFIIDFMNKQCLDESIKKNNKKIYKNDITILIDTYSEEDEHPKAYQFREEPRINDNYSRNYNNYDNQSSGSKLVLGGKSQNAPPPPNSMGPAKYRPPTLGIQIGGRVQRQQSVPPHNNSFNNNSNEKDKPQVTIETGANKFGVLKDDY